MPTLSIQLPGLPPVSHVLKDETITIGRMKGNTIVIEDSSISLMHAKITRKNGDFLLKDLNSTNGTDVNGQPIAEVRLKDQDRVRFAEISCQFLADAAEQVTSTGIAPTVPAPAPVRPLPIVPVPGIPATSPAAESDTKPPQVRRARPFFAPLRYAGAVLAVGVVSMVGWRIFQLNHERSDYSDHAGAATLPASARALTEGKEHALASIPRKAPAEPTSKLLDGSKTSERESSLAKATTTKPKEESSTNEGVSQLVDALKNQDVAERQKAAAALHSLGTGAKDAIPALREALMDEDPVVQMWSALAMVNNQEFDKRTVPVLIRTLQNDNPVLRQVACLSLGLIPYLESEKQSVIPALTDTAYKDANDDVRKAALSALSIVAPETVGKTALK